MGDTPASGETATQPPLENKPSQPATPQPEEKKTEDGEIEKLRKEAEQLKMRNNQLANELKAKADADAAAKTEQLKKNEEYKALSEQLQSKLDSIEEEREAEEQRKAVNESATNILSDYTEEVRDTAKDLGLSLKDLTEDSVKEFKEKLDKLQARSGSQRVTPNNPGTPSGKKQYTGEELRQILADPVKRDAYYRAKGGVTAMMMGQQD